jgi:hypothetical protein
MTPKAFFVPQNIQTCSKISLNTITSQQVMEIAFSTKIYFKIWVRIFTLGFFGGT